MAVTEPPRTTSNAELVRWAFDRISAHDVDALRQFWTPETYERFPDQELTGTDAIAAYFENTFRAIPDFHMEVRQVVEQGEHVFVRWTATGTHEGTFAGVGGTGKRVSVDGVDHFVIRDGKVVSNFVIYDQVQFATAIGLMPPTGSAADKAMKGAFNLRTRALGKLKRR